MTSLDNYAKKLTNQYQIGFTKIKYIRYLNKFIFGVKGKKEIAVQYRQKIIKFISEQLFFKIYEKKVKFIDVSKNSVSFLSCKIYNIKRTNLLSVKSKILEHNSKIKRNIKIQRKIEKNKSFKKIIDSA